MLKFSGMRSSAGKHGKSKIALRFRNINLLFLVLILVIVTTLSAVMISGITEETSRDFARFYSVEAVEVLGSYLSKEITLVQRAAISKEIIAWFADEDNPEKKAAAYREMMEYADVLKIESLYFGIHGSLNEYSVDSGAMFEDFMPFNVLDPHLPYDNWYFTCINSVNDYTLNIDVDRITKTRRLWINYRVMENGNAVGVFCSAFQVDEMFQELFGRYDSRNVIGYIVNENGIIQMDSSESEPAPVYDEISLFESEEERHILDVTQDPVFIPAINKYLLNLDIHQSLRKEPLVISQSGGSYQYLSIAHVLGTNWLAVTFYNSRSLFGVTRLLPTLIFIMSAFMFYAAISTTLVRRLALSPLNQLTRSVDDADFDSKEIYGSDRDDEIGELARTTLDTWKWLNEYNAKLLSIVEERGRQARILNAINTMAAVLFGAEDESVFEASLPECLSLMATCMDVDRIHIWRNETRDGVLHFVQLYRWMNDRGRQESPNHLGRAFPYERYAPDWLENFVRDECVRDTVSNMPNRERKLLASIDVKTALAIPVHLHGHFWGFVSFDNCHAERIPHKDDIDILRSGSLIIASAINRNVQAAAINEVHKHAYLMLNATPMACLLWNRDYVVFDCNEKVIEFFQLHDKQEFKDRFFELSPRYQSDGQDSSEKAIKCIEEAFVNGKCVFEWTHQTLDATPLPSEVTLVRVNYGEGEAVAGYIRDLREYKRMMNEIEHATAQLQAVIANYGGIIWNVNKNNIITLFNGLYLSKIGVTSDFIEGKPLDAARKKNRHLDIIEHVAKTFTEGSQNWISEIDGKLFRAQTTPIYDESGTVTDVVGSVDDITELISLQADLETALKEAQAANRAKSAFLANMSHEIRTPLNSIIGFSELALDGEISPKTKNYLAKIFDNAEGLLQIINDILDLSKVESGKMVLEKIPFDIHELFTSCRNIIFPKADEKGITLYFYAEPSTGKKPLGDPTRLRQVLVNLLSNAIKFTNTGMVKLHADIRHKTDSSITIEFEVKDSGIGMTEDQLEKIFEPFTQAESGTTRKYGGTGLGLPITKNIVEMMGGLLSVESAPGVGSKFSFELTFDTIDVDEDYRKVQELSFNEIERPTFEGEVLLCEDNAMNQNVISEHLARVGLKTVVAGNGKVGVEMVQKRIKEGKKQFDLIFMDMHMPVMDGLEAASKILEFETGIPIVAMTANIMSDDRETYKQSGMNDCVGKPFTSQELWRCLLKYFTPLDRAAGRGNTHNEKDSLHRAARPLKEDGEYRKNIEKVFYKSNRKKYDEIVKALEEGDINHAHKLVHVLKDNSGYIGKTGLQKAAADVEDRLKDGENLASEEQLKSLEAELTAVLDELSPPPGETED
jgi:signal transduction histidine kinase/CheY-like chemotaxis protein